MWHHKSCLHWARPKPGYWWVITAVPPWPFLFFKARQQPKTKITCHECPPALQSTFCANDMKWISIKACSRRRRETLGPCESPVWKSTRSKCRIDVEYLMRAIADFQRAEVYFSSILGFRLEFSLCSTLRRSNGATLTSTKHYCDGSARGPRLLQWRRGQRNHCVCDFQIPKESHRVKCSLWFSGKLYDWVNNEIQSSAVK